MKSVIDEKDWGSALTEFLGARAQLWLFHVSLRRMALRLSRAGLPEVAYLVAVGCEHISASFAWENAAIRIIKPADGSEGHYRIVDKDGGLELVCQSVALARGPLGEFDSSFDGFLGDEPSA